MNPTATHEPAAVYRRNRAITLLSGGVFLAIHLSALLAFAVPFSWSLVALAVGGYVLRMWAITTGYHRYFAHRSFKTGRVFQFVLAFLGATSTQKGPLWWASWHRIHHKYSDQPEDVHSPVQRGFWYSHVGWIMNHKHDDTDLKLIKDFAAYPELRLLDQFFWVPPVVYAAVCYLIAGVPGLVWGYSVSTVLLWHGTFTINSLSHVFGTRRYETTDTSRNNPLLALITLGEGWHNNHHHYMGSANQGFFWWEVDLSYYSIKALELVGVVSDVRKPPAHLLDPVQANARAARSRLDELADELVALKDQVAAGVAARREELAVEVEAKRAALVAELEKRRHALAADFVAKKDALAAEVDALVRAVRQGERRPSSAA